MYHGRSLGRLSRTSAHRKALLRNLLTALVFHERIVTTKAKAKHVKLTFDTVMDKLRLGLKRNDVKMLRKLEASFFEQPKVLPMLTGPLLARYNDYKLAFHRQSNLVPTQQATLPQTITTGKIPLGYCRIHLHGWRKGDKGDRAVVELIGNPRDIGARLAARHLPQIELKIQELARERTEPPNKETGEKKSYKRLAEQQAFLEKLAHRLKADMVRYEKAKVSYEQWLEKAQKDELSKAQSIIDESKRKLSILKRVAGEDGVVLSERHIEGLKKRGLLVTRSGEILEEKLDDALMFVKKGSETRGRLQFKYLDLHKYSQENWKKLDSVFADYEQEMDQIALDTGHPRTVVDVDSHDVKMGDEIEEPKKTSGLGSLFKKLF